MCSDQYYYALLGSRDSDYMVMCRRDDFSKRKIKRITRRILPHICGYVATPKLVITSCYEKFPSKFDRQIAAHAEEHDWDEYPFVLLQCLDEEEQKVCRATHVSLG
jgi:hypothetical protein